MDARGVHQGGVAAALDGGPSSSTRCRFSYYKDPEGNIVEYTAEVEQITGPNRQPRVQAPFADQWVTAQAR